MDINNIAIVRAEHRVPFDGIIRTISNSPYLCKNIGLEFSSQLSELLKRSGLTPKIDYSKIQEEGYYEDFVLKHASSVREYLPFVSDYNSMVFFSLNGLCPDDKEHGFGNNTFSNRKCAVIDYLSAHIENVVSLNPTDTTIKGDVTLSNQATILIEENFFHTLNEYEKKQLLNLDLHVKIFKGDLKTTIHQELQNSKDFSAETLSLSSSTGGIMPSETSENLKEAINTLCIEYGFSQKKYFDLLMTQEETNTKEAAFKEELPNALKVIDYYLFTFLQKLLIVINAPQEMLEELPDKLHDKFYMERVCEQIEKFGIEKYKNFVDCYNEDLKQKQLLGQLETPEEIILNQKEKWIG